MANKIKINIENQHLPRDTTTLYKYCLEFYQDAVKFLRRELLFYYLENDKLFTDSYLMKTLRKKFDEEMHFMEYIPVEVVNFAFEKFASRKKEVEAKFKKVKDVKPEEIFSLVEELFTMDFKLEDVVNTFIPYKKG